MKVMQAIFAVGYENYYGDSFSLFLARDPDSSYEWEVFDSENDLWDSYTTEGLRNKVNDICSEYDECSPEYHDEDHDDFDHYEDECEYVKRADTRAAWNAVLSAALHCEQFGSPPTGQDLMAANMAQVAAEVLSEEATAICKYPQVQATINYSDTRLAIREAVTRALELGGIHQGKIDQWRYECDTAPDPLAAAREWVSC